MASYIAMLRGINVGGRAKVSMADLRATFSDMGYGEVETYIQSGNVMFGASGSATKLQSTIEQGLEDRFGLGIKVVLRTRAQLEKAIVDNPLADGRRDDAKLHVTFLGAAPASSLVSSLDTGGFLPDEFAVRGRDVYVHCPEGYGRTKLNNAFFERTFGVTATTRTVRTVTTLVAMAA
ncbi:MAG TPA: DUF1697 domain-containing protein [Acidimicrobiales bacterium]|nr:DUF1697 domain-containing protein [Acidimicrobiales bacterium]